MNPANLPFDSELMLQGLRAWVECESPTWDARAVDRMLDLAAREMAIMGATIERIAGRQGFAGCVRARFPHPKQGEPGILIAGHLDTVHPVGTLEKLAWRREGNRCYGPGIFDMKGGSTSPSKRSGDWPAPRSRRRCRSPFCSHPTKRSAHRRPATSSRPKPPQTDTCWCPSRAAPTTASSPGDMPLPASISKRSASRAMPAPRSPGPFRDPRDGTPVCRLSTA